MTTLVSAAYAKISVEPILPINAVLELIELTLTLIAELGVVVTVICELGVVVTVH
jgi:hypothetical protein